MTLSATHLATIARCTNGVYAQFTHASAWLRAPKFRILRGIPMHVPRVSDLQDLDTHSLSVLRPHASCRA